MKLSRTVLYLNLIALTFMFGLARVTNAQSEAHKKPSHQVLIKAFIFTGKGNTSLTGVTNRREFEQRFAELKRRGSLQIESRRYGVVRDGEPLNFDVEYAIPVIKRRYKTSVIPGSIPSLSVMSQFEATPRIQDIPEGSPLISLTLSFENTATELPLSAPATLNRQSLQTVVPLKENEIAILGGLATSEEDRGTKFTDGFLTSASSKRRLHKQGSVTNQRKLYIAVEAQVIP